jgi:hypothetical protein
MFRRQPVLLRAKEAVLVRPLAQVQEVQHLVQQLRPALAGNRDA